MKKPTVTSLIIKNSRKLSGFLGTLFIVLGWYLIGPFLFKDTWQQLNYRLKYIREKFHIH